MTTVDENFVRVTEGGRALCYHGWFDRVERPWWAFWRPSYVYREEWYTLDLTKGNEHGG